MWILFITHVNRGTATLRHESGRLHRSDTTGSLKTGERRCACTLFRRESEGLGGKIGRNWVKIISACDSTSVYVSILCCCICVCRYFCTLLSFDLSKPTNFTIRYFDHSYYDWFRSNYVHLPNEMLLRCSWIKLEIELTVSGKLLSDSLIILVMHKWLRRR